MVAVHNVFSSLVAHDGMYYHTAVGMTNSDAPSCVQYRAWQGIRIMKDK